MNAFILVIFLLISRSQAACLPDSSFLLKTNLFNIQEIESAVEDFNTTVKGSLPQNTELIVKLDSLNPRVNADIKLAENIVVIEVLGGMLGHPEMNTDVLQLLLCHELGHFLGGAPFKSRNGWSSTEGQADYFTGLNCAKILGFNEAMFLTAAQKLTKIYAQVVRQPEPRLNQCDESVVTRINYGYPSVQCRLDTLVAGWNQIERPRCWFIE